MMKKPLALLLLLSLSAPALAQAPHFSLGSTRYLENNASTQPEGTDGGYEVLSLGDGVPIGVWYLRSVVISDPDDTWRNRDVAEKAHWLYLWSTACEAANIPPPQCREPNYDLADWSEYIRHAERARDLGILYHVRIPVTMYPSNWLTPPYFDYVQNQSGERVPDARTAEFQREWRALWRGFARNVLPVYSRTVVDGAVQGPTNEPRIDLMPSYYGGCGEYVRSQVRLTEIMRGEIGNRLVGYIWSGCEDREGESDWGVYYAREMLRIGMVGFRQDGMGSYAKSRHPGSCNSQYRSGEYHKVRTAEPEVFSGLVALEQWGGNAAAWTTSFATRDQDFRCHLRDALHWGATTMNFMGASAGAFAPDYRWWYEETNQGQGAVKRIQLLAALGEDPEPPPVPNAYSFSVSDSTGGSYLYGVAVSEADVESGIYNDPDHFPWVGSRSADLPRALTIGFLAAKNIPGYGIRVQTIPEDTDRWGGLSIWPTEDESETVYRFVFNQSVSFEVSYERDAEPPPGGWEEAVAELTRMHFEQQAEIESLQGEILMLKRRIDALSAVVRDAGEKMQEAQ